MISLFLSMLLFVPPPRQIPMNSTTRNTASYRPLNSPPYLGITGTSRREPFFPSMSVFLAFMGNVSL
jgi:hypothetical protein